MALSSTLYRFKIQVSDVSRDAYETLELRVARHPSESMPFFLARVLAYCLNTQPGLEFTDGISTPDLPALWVKDLTGLLEVWIDIGNPAAKRLHKAAKAARRVRVYTYRDIAILQKEMAGEEIHARERIEVFALTPAFLDRLGATIERDNAWELLHDDGELTVTTAHAVISGELVLHAIR